MGFRFLPHSSSFRELSSSASHHVEMLLLHRVLLLSCAIQSILAICKESDYFVFECQFWEDVVKLPEKSSISELVVTNRTLAVACDETTFRGFNNLTILTVHPGGFTDIHPNCFDGLRTLKNVEIMENQLTSVSLASLNGSLVERLWLHGNLLRNLSFHGMRLPVLRSLGLSSNYLDHIEITTESLPDLRILDLSFNNLTSVSVEGDSLSFIKLQSNLLTELTADNIKGPSIRMLYLSENKLTEIRGSLFANVPRVEFVHFEKNPVQLIDFSHFNMTSIRCSDQMILLTKRHRQAAPLSVDVSWERVQALILTNNSLDRLDVFDFSAAKATLAELRMDRNVVREIKRDDLQQLTGLIVLDLSYNRISSIEDGAFEGLQKLHSLSLAHNCIHGLSDHMFMLSYSLYALDLSHNIMTYFIVSGWNPANTSISLTQYHVRPSHAIYMQLHATLICLWFLL